MPAGALKSRPDVGLENISQQYAKTSHGFSIIEISESTLDVYFFDIDVWKPEAGIFTLTPSFEDYDFHCRINKDTPSVCQSINKG